MSTPQKILLVDDHTILLDGLKSLLHKSDKNLTIETAASGIEALQKLKSFNADIVITDLNMPGMDGMELIKAIKEQLPPTKIIVLSLHDEAHYIRTVMKHRVQGYILKNDSGTELIEAVEKVLEGKTYLSSKISEIMMDQLDQPATEQLLSERELQILKLITAEFSNKQIADKLFISERTVETHRKNIFRKAGTNTVVGLVKFAYTNNIIT